MPLKHTHGEKHAVSLEAMPLMLSQAVISGILMGAVYALLALGLTMVFGVMHVINVSHGEMLMLGAYVSFWLFHLLGLSPLVSILFAAPIMFCVGALLEKGIVEKVVEDIETNSLLVTFGVSICIINIAIWLWTTDFKAIPYLSGSWLYGSLVFSQTARGGGGLRTLPERARLLLSQVLPHGQGHPRYGRRARTSRPSAGIYVKRVYLVTFGLASAMGGAAGVLASIMFAIYPEMGDSFLMRSFTVIVLGGMGHVVGAMAGGMLLGLAEGVGSLYLSGEGGGAISFAILLLVLLLRPHWAHGTPGRLKVGKCAVGAAGLLVLFLYPWFAGPYFISMALLIFMYVALASSWNIISGFTGYVSLGHAVFFGVGAYLAALQITNWETHWLPAALLAGVGTSALAVPTGLLCLRLRGPFFAIFMLGLNELMAIVASVYDNVTGGAEGLSLPILRQIVPLYYAMGGVRTLGSSRDAVAGIEPLRLAPDLDSRGRNGGRHTGDEHHPLQTVRLCPERVLPGRGGGHLRPLHHLHRPRDSVQHPVQRPDGVDVHLGGARNGFGDR